MAFMTDPVLLALLQMTEATQCLNSQIMDPKLNAEKDWTVVDDYVKIFLTTVKNFDKIAFPSQPKPIWKGKSNFLSMLNVPQMIRDHGSV